MVLKNYGLGVKKDKFLLGLKAGGLTLSIVFRVASGNLCDLKVISLFWGITYTVSEMSDS